MPLRRLGLGVILMAGVAGSMPASASKDLAIRSVCMGCHQIDRKVVGPAFRDIAARYVLADEAKLVEKVLRGGGGAWGVVPMPPQATLKPEDARTLVRWILTGAK
jgi:cytochrome c